MPRSKPRVLVCPGCGPFERGYDRDVLARVVAEARTAWSTGEYS